MPILRSGYQTATPSPGAPAPRYHPQELSGRRSRGRHSSHQRMQQQQQQQQQGAFILGTAGSQQPTAGTSNSGLDAGATNQPQPGGIFGATSKTGTNAGCSFDAGIYDANRERRGRARALATRWRRVRARVARREAEEQMSAPQVSAPPPASLSDLSWFGLGILTTLVAGMIAAMTT
ncbi:hypothetical protein OC845_006931 [Tilletia horrida]|nr:hypothetical protein OC845_006931 [Tilletia horrida]